MQDNKQNERAEIINEHPTEEKVDVRTVSDYSVEENRQDSCVNGGGKSELGERMGEVRVERVQPITMTTTKIKPPDLNGRKEMKMQTECLLVETARFSKQF